MNFLEPKNQLLAKNYHILKVFLMYQNLKNNNTLGVHNLSSESNTLELFSLLDNLQVNFKESLKFALLLHTKQKIQTLSDKLDWPKIESSILVNA